MTSETPEAAEPEILLGRDLSDDPAPDVPQQQEQEQEPEQPQAPSYDFIPQGMTKEQFEALSQKARYYDQMESDPGLVRAVQDYYQHKVRGVDNESTQQNNVQGSENGTDRMIQQLLNNQKQLHAAIQVMDFERRHPDFNEVRDDVVNMVRQHPTMTLEQAYGLAKQLRGAAAKGSSIPPREQSETQTRVPSASSRESSHEELMRSAMDRKRYRSTGDALKGVFEQLIRENND